MIQYQDLETNNENEQYTRQHVGVKIIHICKTSGLDDSVVRRINIAMRISEYNI